MAQYKSASQCPLTALGLYLLVEGPSHRWKKVILQTMKYTLLLVYSFGYSSQEPLDFMVTPLVEEGIVIIERENL